MGYKIKNITDVTVYDKDSKKPIMHLDIIDPAITLSGEEYIDPKFNDAYIYFTFTKGNKDFNLKGFLEVFN